MESFIDLFTKENSVNHAKKDLKEVLFVCLFFLNSIWIWPFPFAHLFLTALGAHFPFRVLFPTLFKLPLYIGRSESSCVCGPRLWESPGPLSLSLFSTPGLPRHPPETLSFLLLNSADPHSWILLAYIVFRISLIPNKIR